MGIAERLVIVKKTIGDNWIGKLRQSPELLKRQRLEGLFGNQIMVVVVSALLFESLSWSYTQQFE